MEGGDESRETLSFAFDESSIELPRPTAVAGATVLALHNRGDEAQLAMLERRLWAGDAATVAEGTALQEFRDLFSPQILDPEE